MSVPAPPSSSGPWLPLADPIIQHPPLEPGTFLFFNQPYESPYGKNTTVLGMVLANHYPQESPGYPGLLVARVVMVDENEDAGELLKIGIYKLPRNIASVGGRPGRRDAVKFNTIGFYPFSAHFFSKFGRQPDEEPAFRRVIPVLDDAQVKAILDTFEASGWKEKADTRAITERKDFLSGRKPARTPSSITPTLALPPLGAALIATLPRNITSPRSQLGSRLAAVVGYAQSEKGDILPVLAAIVGLDSRQKTMPTDFVPDPAHPDYAFLHPKAGSFDVIATEHLYAVPLNREFFTPAGGNVPEGELPKIKTIGQLQKDLPAILAMIGNRMPRDELSGPVQAAPAPRPEPGSYVICKFPHWQNPWEPGPDQRPGLILGYGDDPAFAEYNYGPMVAIVAYSTTAVPGADMRGIINVRKHAEGLDLPKDEREGPYIHAHNVRAVPINADFFPKGLARIGRITDRRCLDEIMGTFLNIQGRPFEPALNPGAFYDGRSQRPPWQRIVREPRNGNTSENG